MKNKSFKYSKELSSLINPPKRNYLSYIKKSLAFLIVTAFFGAIFGYFFSQKIARPEENNLLAELDEMKLQYEILNKKLNVNQEVLKELGERDNSIYRAYFEMDTIPEDVRKSGFGGVNRYAKFSNWKYGDIVAETTKSLDVLSKQLVTQSKSLDEIIASAKEKEKMLLSLPAIQPIENKNLKRLASGFGLRLHPILKIKRMHQGMDFSASIGTPIYATGDAVVKSAGRQGGYGNVVILNHGYGYQTLYAHLNKISVRQGQKVKRGEIIGQVGNTGLSTGPHLHYEIIKNGERIDPISFFYQDLTPEEYKILLEKSQRMSVSLD